jgi:predicted metalloprotease with PDZ domain
MRSAYAHYAGQRGFTAQQFRGLVEDAASRSLVGFWADAIDGTAELKYAEALDYFGLRFKPDSALPGQAQKAWLGAATKIEDGRLVITQVKRGTPAFRAGVNVDDELIAIDDLRVRPDKLDQRLEQYVPGERVTVLVARREQLVTLHLTLGAEPARLWRLEVDPIATPLQADRLNAWLKGASGAGG